MQHALNIYTNDISIRKTDTWVGCKNKVYKNSTIACVWILYNLFI